MQAFSVRSPLASSERETDMFYCILNAEDISFTPQFINHRIDIDNVTACIMQIFKESEHTSYLITYLNDLMSDFDIYIGLSLSQKYVLCTIIIWMHFFRMHQILYVMHQILQII